MGGYSQLIQNMGDAGKNVFLIQILKDSFMTVVNEGVSFVVGFKLTNKHPVLMKFIHREDIEKVNLVDVSYMLMVSTYIPTSD